MVKHIALEMAKILNKTAASPSSSLLRHSSLPTPSPQSSLPSPSPPQSSLPTLSPQSSLPSPSPPQIKSKLNVHWTTTFKFMIGSIMILSGSLAIYLLVQLFKIQDFHKKSTNRMGPMFGLFNWLTNLFGALTFRKPYTTFLISLFGWLLSSFSCLALPGLWEWCEMLCIVLVPLGLGFQHFWNGIRYRNKDR